MVNYRKNCSEPWFSIINLGLKPVEGRLNKGDFAKLQVGDTITFFNEDFNYREFTVKVTKLTYYKTFEAYLRKETLKKCLPGIKTIKDGLSVYYKYFTKEQEEKFGVVCISVELL